MPVKFDKVAFMSAIEGVFAGDFLRYSEISPSGSPVEEVKPSFIVAS